MFKTPITTGLSSNNKLPFKFIDKGIGADMLFII